MTPGPVSDLSPGPSDGSPLDEPICIVFNNEDPSTQVFIEVETVGGKSISVGEWEDGEPYAKLKITPRGIMRALGLDSDFEVLSCAFCGFEYVGPDNPAPRDRLDAHIRECAQHPARELVQLLTDIEAALLASYQSVMKGGERDSDLLPALVTRVMEATRRWGTDSMPLPQWPKAILDQLVEVIPLESEDTT